LIVVQPFRNALSDDKIESIETQVVEAAESGDHAAAWESAQPLVRAQRHQEEAAKSLARLVDRQCFAIDNAIETLEQIRDANPGNRRVLGWIGEALEGARDIDELNAPPPEHPLFLTVVDELEKLAAEAHGTEAEEKLLSGLAAAARMVSRQRDALAEASYLRLVELDPGYDAYHYNLGLFYKTRGRFAEGVSANQAAEDCHDEPPESYEWNLGICATGAGEGEIALEVWKRIGCKIEMGRFDLPDGGFPMCKVKLAQRPLAERDTDNDDPGRQETIWIERVSPCHGIVRSVLFQDLGVDYGDVVLFDGAPITYHRYGDEEYPVFPHLATLHRRGYEFYDFAGTQDESGRLADTSDELEGDCIVYSHTEQFQMLCNACWRDPDIEHEHEKDEEHNVVSGRIAAPPEFDPVVLLEQLDAAVAAQEPCRLYAPSLCIAAGQDERAAVEQRRYDMLKNNQ